MCNGYADTHADDSTSTDDAATFPGYRGRRLTNTLEIDIEDLTDARCRLVCAPVVPSQSVVEYPLSLAHVFDNDETGVWEYGKREAEVGPCRVARGRTRDSSRLPSGSKFAVGGRRRESASAVSLLRPPEDIGPSTAASLTPVLHRQLDHDDWCEARPFITSQHSQARESISQCLLERVNPEYFEQDKYKWHSSTERAKAMSEMMSIDPESAQDFTALYSSEKTTTQHDMLHFNTSTAFQLPECAVPDLDGGSSPSKSIDSSPDSLMQPCIKFDRQSSEDSIFELEAFEDVNRMFDWDEACASLVDEGIPNYKPDDSAMPKLVHYNTSAFRSIPMIQPRQRFADAGHRPGEYSTEHGYEDMHDVHDQASTPVSSPHADGEDGPSTVCHNCRVTKTPLWRRTPDKRHSLCNACGLYLKQYKTMRPLVPRNRSQAAKKDEENIVCTNCEATKTSLWRKDEHGQVICNACGLYYKLHGKPRPVAMRKEKISRRKRYRNLAAEDANLEGLAGLQRPTNPPVLLMSSHQMVPAREAPSVPVQV